MPGASEQDGKKTIIKNNPIRVGIEFSLVFIVNSIEWIQKLTRNQQ